MKIYIVSGETGEWEDKQGWYVKAFSSKDKAENYLAKCNDWLEKNCPDPINWIIYQNLINYGELKNPHDPGFQYDYTGTIYFIDELEVDISPDEISCEPNCPCRIKEECVHEWMHIPLGDCVDCIKCGAIKPSRPLVPIMEKKEQCVLHAFECECEECTAKWKIIEKKFKKDE